MTHQISTWQDGASWIVSLDGLDAQGGAETTETLLVLDDERQARRQAARLGRRLDEIRADFFAPAAWASLLHTSSAAVLLGSRGGRANTPSQAAARARPKAGAGRPRKARST